MKNTLIRWSALFAALYMLEYFAYSQLSSNMITMINLGKEFLKSEPIPYPIILILVYSLTQWPIIIASTFMGIISSCSLRSRDLKEMTVWDIRFPMFTALVCNIIFVKVLSKEIYWTMIGNLAIYAIFSILAWKYRSTNEWRN